MEFDNEDLSGLLLLGERLIHDLVDDLHFMFQIVASRDVTHDVIQNRHQLYCQHMQQLHKVVTAVNQELERNPIHTERYSNQDKINTLREERDELIEMVKNKNKVLKGIIDRLRHLQLSVNTIKGLPHLIEPPQLINI